MSQEYFTPDGHLTFCAFDALSDGTADELLRLEISEHLSFCDECIEKYSAYMTNSNLLTPPKSLTSEISKAIVKHSLKDTASRYFWACTAACLTITFWVNGIFTPDISNIERYDFSEKTEEITKQAQKLSEQISDSITDFLDNHGNNIYNQHNK